MNKLYGSCSVINVPEDAGGMISVNYATEMEKGTISASHIFIKMIMMSVSRNLSMRSHCVTFYSERPETNIFLVEARVSLFVEATSANLLPKRKIVY